MKRAVVAGLIVLGVMQPAQAVAPQPKLTGYICIDQKGVHHRASAVFEGVYCQLVPNPKYKG